ncbi:MAG TPA: DUF2807 domain-containing protein [Polyangiales bacterium]|nr:DUF2807 domain-containing protein [Polyangiales bacterium]
METNSLRLCSVVFGLGIAFATACASETADDAIIGSRKLKALTTDTTFVQSVTIFLPFDTIVRNGELHKLVVRGEDNLIDRIAVEETAAGKWRISAPMDMNFEQHDGVEVEIPYIDMVEIRVDSERVEFADEPATVWTSDDA